LLRYSELFHKCGSLVFGNILAKNTKPSQAQCSSLLIIQPVSTVAWYPGQTFASDGKTKTNESLINVKLRR